MKISDLIIQLLDISAKHGDIDVRMWDSEEIVPRCITTVEYTEEKQVLYATVPKHVLLGLD